MKYKRKYLKDILKNYSPFPDAFSQVNPIYKEGYFLFPYYGEMDSKHMLAMGIYFLKGTNKPTSDFEFFQKYMDQKIEDKKYIAYNISHELKIATIASSIALQNQDSNVYEIGPGFGNGTLHYSRIMKESEIPSSKTIYKITSIEKNNDFYDIANNLLNGC